MKPMFCKWLKCANRACECYYFVFLRKKIDLKNEYEC
ncbi:hypothetical protein FHS64_000127 [Brevundimonas terrae]|nr:hypothetical protein [Brevundimonas terrae]